MRFKADNDPNKVYLNYSYRNEDGTPHAFSSVMKAEKLVFENPNYVILFNIDFHIKGRTGS